MAVKRKLIKAVLITGATSGIGLELAKVFGREKHHLILVGRSKTKLQEVQKEIHQKYKAKIELITQDLTSPNAPQLIFARTKRLGFQVEILVNDAGIGAYGKFTQSKLEDELQVIQLNINTLTVLTKLFAQDMAGRRAGKILNIASTSGFFPGPLMAVYYASKAYVLSFTLALREELKKDGIQVSVLAPGPTKTHFAENAGSTKSRLFHSGKMSSKSVAQAAYKGLMRNEAVIIPGSSNQAMVFLSRFVPRTFQAKMMRFMNDSR